MLPVNINYLKMLARGNMGGVWLQAQSVLGEKGEEHPPQFPRPRKEPWPTCQKCTGETRLVGQLLPFPWGSVPTGSTE